MDASRSEVLLRSPSAKTPQGEPKTALKEKFVAVYQALFSNQDPSGGRGDDFWDEVFLLKVNAAFLERCIVLTSEEALLGLAKSLHVLLSQCVRAVADPNAIRVVRALETLAVLFKHIFRKKFANFGFDILNLCGGFERGDVVFRNLVTNVVALLNDPQREVAHKSAAVSLLVILVTGAENINQNSLIEYLHRDEAFNALINLPAQLQAYPPSNAADGLTSFQAIFVCVALLNYQKYENARNSFSVRVAAINEAHAHRMLSATLTDVLAQCRVSSSSVLSEKAPEESKSIISKVLGGLWSTSPAQSSVAVLSPELLRARQGAVLLSVYELCYLNRDFFLRAFLESHGVVWDRLNAKKGANGLASGNRGADLLREFIQLSSILFLTVKDERSALHAKLAMLLLTVVAEDESLMDCMHDAKFAFKPPIVTHRKSKSVPVAPGDDQLLPPVFHVLDVLLEFLKNNVHNQLQVKLHMQCLSIFHRVLCFQKSNHLCLKRFKWDQLWKQMFRLLGFVSRDEWMRKPEVIELCELITTIFNMFITFGDTFLPSGNDYDFLYYELIRETRTVSAMSDLVDKYAANSTLALQHENLRLIISHFKSRIDQWTAANEGAAMSPEDVLGVIKRNYGSLKLTLLDNLDVYTPYMEQPAQVSFFRQLIRTVVLDYKSVTTIN